MSDLAARSDITNRDLAKGRNLKIATVSAPLVLGGVPAVVFLALVVFAAATPPVAATFFFLGLILSIIGFMLGLDFRAFFFNDFRDCWSDCVSRSPPGAFGPKRYNRFD